ncbi:MAG TPA: PASTA domain-containing protein, partial [Acidimicrobiales bacterium]|nr:PASTA domain-containing protein [Acidimicrobiales bacterium]
PPRHDPLAAMESRRPPRPPQGRRLALIAAAVVVLVVAIALGAAWKLGAFKSTHAVPTLVGLTVAQAGGVITADHVNFSVSVTSRAHSSSVPANQIISQTPAAGTAAKSGQVIDVIVSAGPTMVAVPANLVGQDCAGATQELLGLHLNARCPTSSEILSNAVAPGRVVRVRLGATVNPTRVPINSTLLLVLSRGPATTTTTTPPTTTTTVVGPTTTTTIPAADLTTVPNVVGLTRAQVFAAMKAADLYFATVPNTTHWTKATGQSPAPGTKVKKLSTVTVDVK